jgi:phage pi2 protein 07
MKKSYVCHFYGEDPAASKDNVQKICRNLTGMYSDILPIAPQLYFDHFSSDEKDRDRVMSWCLELITMCDELVVFGPKISSGMVEEIIFAICTKKIHVSLGKVYYPKFSNGGWEFSDGPFCGFDKKIVKEFNEIYKSALRIREKLN